ncbi:MAG: phosphoenolpyruvate carboxykinase domain-containing protein [Candidatus Nanopelagicales bacterium]
MPTSCPRSTRSTGSARTTTASSCGRASATTHACSSWIIERVEGGTEAEQTAIGGRPKDGDLYLEGLDLTDEQVAELFAVDPKSWLAEADLTEEYFAKFGDKVPAKLQEELTALRERLRASE